MGFQKNEYKTLQHYPRDNSSRGSIAEGGEQDTVGCHCEGLMQRHGRDRERETEKYCLTEKQAFSHYHEGCSTKLVCRAKWTSMFIFLKEMNCNKWEGKESPSHCIDVPAFASLIFATYKVNCCSGWTHQFWSPGDLLYILLCDYLSKRRFAPARAVRAPFTRSFNRKSVLLCWSIENDEIESWGSLINVKHRHLKTVHPQRKGITVSIPLFCNPDAV